MEAVSNFPLGDEDQAGGPRPDGAEVTGGISFPQASRFLVYLFCLYAFFWYLQIGYRVEVLGELRFELVCGGLLAVLSFLSAPRIDWSNKLVPVLAVYLLLVLFQVIFSYDAATSWNVFVDRILKHLVICFLIVSLVRSPRDLRLFLAAFLLACMKLGLEGFLGKLTGGLIWENQGVMRLHGPTPIYGHPNSFAGMAVGTLPFVYFLWPVVGRRLRWALAVLALFSCNIILYSGSRTAYVALFLLLLYLFTQCGNKRRFFTRCLVLAALAFPLVPGDYKERVGSIFSMEDKEGHSTELRKEILRDAWDIFLSHPLGVGVGAFPKIRQDTFGRVQDTHNLYLEIATNLGVQGIAAFAVVVCTMLKLLGRVRRRAGEYLEFLDSAPSGLPAGSLDELRLLHAAAAAVSGFIIARLGLGLFGMDLYEVYWWFAAGLTFSLCSMLRRYEETLMPLLRGGREI